MVADGTYTAVLDRFEGDEAVLVLARDGEDIADYPVDRTRLPGESRQQDAVFDVVIEDGSIAELQYDSEETARRHETAQDRFDRLSKRPPDDGE